MTRRRRVGTEPDYAGRINRVLDHVLEHLSEPLPLERLARVASFSPFHFHRVFRTMTGESLRDFVARARVERAAQRLGREASQLRLTDLGLECGFSTPSEFSRLFKEHFGVTPSQFRRDFEKRKNTQASALLRPYLSQHERSGIMASAPRLVTRPAQRLAYVRADRCFAKGRIAAAQRRLLYWAARRGATVSPLLGLSRDDPDITPAAQCRYDVAFACPPEWRPEDDLGVRLLPAGVWAEVELRGDAGTILAGWSALFSEWLPTSGFEPADVPAVERFLVPPDFDTWSHFDLELALCVVRS